MSSVKLLSIMLLGFLMAGCFQQNKQSQADAWQTIEKRGYLIIGATLEFPPQGFLDEKGQPTGFEVELIHLVAKELMGDEKAVKLERTTSATWQSLLNYNQVDFLMASQVYNPVWAKRYVYGKPYYNSVFRVVARKDSGIKTLADLKGKKVTFLFGGTSEGILKTKAPKGTILTGFRTINDELIAFKAKRVDAFAQQEAVLKYLLQDECGLDFLPEKLAPQPFSPLYNKGEYNKILIDKVEAALAKLEKNGTIAKLKAKWYPDLKLEECSK